MKFNIGLVCMACLIFLSNVTIAQENQQEKQVTIGVVIDGPWERNEELFEIFKNEIFGLLSRDFDIRFPTDKIITANWTREGVQSALDSVLADSEVGIVLAMGVYSSADVSLRTEIPKPVIAPFIIDPKFQGLSLKNGASGIKNLNYISAPMKTESDISIYKDVIPITKAAMIISKHTVELHPGMIDSLEVLSSQKEFELVPVISDIQPDSKAELILDALPDDIDAVFMSLLFPLSPDESKRLFSGLIDRRLPSFSGFFREDIENGVFAGNVSESFFNRRARRVALNLQRILLGEDAGTLPVSMTDQNRLLINMETARAISSYPSFSVLTEAEIINPIREVTEREINLNSAINEALQVNLDLAAKQQFVTAGAQDIKEARSNLLPRFEISALQTFIDEDRADASFGQYAERMLSGSATISQILFSEPVWANYTIQKHIQKSRESEFEALKLSIAHDTSIAYLDLLKSKKIEDIQRENLKLIRVHLELAQVRQAVGISGPADVYRWESEIASRRKNVIEANSLRNAREIQLNRLLNRPLEESFTTEEISLEDANFVMSDQRLLKHFNNKWSFELLRKFLTQVGLDSSPELRALDAAIAAQERALSSAQRAFYIPSVGLQGDMTNKFMKEGAGSKTSALHIPGVTPPEGIKFSEPKDNSWNIGINLSFPLYEGGHKNAAYTKSKIELRKLTIERNSTAERIEQNIRFALHIAGSSNAGISLSRAAAEAAHKSLELIMDSYAQGLVSFIELLEVQNAALNADLAASNAEYNFLIDLMKVERAVGKMNFLMSADEKEQFFNDLDANIKEAQSLSSEQ